MSSLSSVALRQAAARTQLVVDCAGLVRRIQQLDQEVAQYDQWQKSPDSAYDSKVKQRFEESRAREAAEAQRRGIGNFPSTPRSGSWRPASARIQEEQEGKVALQHLERALRSADLEAQQWRNRVMDLEMASDREREQARRLMEFELSEALKEAEMDQAKLQSQMLDRDAAFDKLESEHRSLKSECEAQRQTLRSTLNRVDEHQAHHQHLRETVAAKDAEVAAARTELQSAHRHSEAAWARLDDLKMELKLVEDRQQAQLQALEHSQAEAGHLARNLATRDADLAEAGQRLESAALERDHLRVSLLDAQSNVHELQDELVVSRERCTDARRKAELLHAKCTNLEAALDTATTKQAESALEREEFQEKATRLEQQTSRLRRDLEEARGGAKYDATGKPFEGMLSAASTMASTTASTSPRGCRPLLPPVRPPSAGRPSPKQQRHDMHLLR